MKTTRCLFTQLFFVLSLLLLISNSVQAETTECTVITSLPYVINTQGVYCLKGHLTTSMTSGDAITINTNNVVLDLNGYKLGGLAAGPGTNTRGISAYERENITIRNGTVRGFSMGITINADSDMDYSLSKGHLIEDIRADRNTWMGIHVAGYGCIIRNNQVFSTFGSPYPNVAYGILVNGAGARILNNDVPSLIVNSTTDAAFIFLWSASGSVVENNRVGQLHYADSVSRGIAMFDSQNVLVSNNRVMNTNYGVFYSGSSGKYRDNLTSNVTNPYSGGTDAGGNN